MKVTNYSGSRGRWRVNRYQTGAQTHL